MHKNTLKHTKIKTATLDYSKWFQFSHFNIVS